MLKMDVLTLWQVCANLYRIRPRKKNEKKIRILLRIGFLLSLSPYRQSDKPNQTKPQTKPNKMTTPSQIEKMEQAKLTRLQIANVKNDSKKYTDAEISEYIKNCK